MSQIKTLKIENYKGFYEEQTIDFANPDQEKNGSGLTLIVGPNNTGKTTVIDALLLPENTLYNATRTFKETERHIDGLSPKITIQSDDKTCIYTNIDYGSQIDNLEKINIKYEAIQSRRYWAINSNSTTTLDQFANTSIQMDTRKPSESNTAAVLNLINRDRDQKDKFNLLMRKIIPHFTNWTIDTNEQGNYVKYITGNTQMQHPVNILGDGLLSTFRICAHLVSEDISRILIIDEPELSLHPNAQKALSTIISEFSKKKQIILCTHSPYFVNWSDFANGAQFIRLNKINDKKCTISKLENESKYSSFLTTSIEQWQKPQVLDIAAKEILFSEKVLFVEGQEDVGLIRKWAMDNHIDLNFEVFGYGVGSYSNMGMFLEMANDLGLVKVAALYDNGPDSKPSYDVNKNKYPGYCFQILSTDDIRDKCHDKKYGGDGSIVKIGCFDQHGILKTEYGAEFNQIMDNFNKFFEDPS